MGPEGPPPLIDLHEDLALYFAWHGGGQALGRFDDDVEGRQADLPKYKRANVRIVFASVFGGAGLPSARGAETAYAPSIEKLWEQVRVYHKLAAMYGITIVESYAQAADLLRGGWRLGFLLHVEGLDAVADPADLDMMYRLGVRSVGLTWNYGNRFASSCCHGPDYGLTEEGAELVRRAQRLGMIVDLAHAGRRAALEAAREARRPVIISHAAVRALVDRPRNVDDEVIEAVARTGGVVGVTLIPTLLRERGRPSVADVAEHIVYLRDRFGVHVIALGTDFHGMPGMEPPEGLEDVSKIVRLWEELEERGFTRKEIEDIAYGNALRVLERAIG